MVHHFGEKNISQKAQKHLQKKYEEDLFFDWFSSVIFDDSGHLKSLNQFQTTTEVVDVLYPVTSQTKSPFLTKLFENQRQHVLAFPQAKLEKYFKESTTIADFQNKITDALKANTNPFTAHSF